MRIYNVPLEAPPDVKWIGLGQHGAHSTERFLIRDAWCLHLFRDPMQLRVGMDFFAVERGSCTLIPPSTPIEFHFPTPQNHTHVFSHFATKGNLTHPLPGFIPKLSEFERHFQALQSVLGQHNARGAARLWDILWSIEAISGLHETADSLVSRALQIIETRLHEPLCVAQIARDLGVSHNHLTRSFQKENSATVVGTIQARRVARATYLLQNTTLPIKAIGAQCGLGDFHSLNKTLRRVTGEGPRDIRLGKTLYQPEE